MAIKIKGDIVIDDNENLIITGYGSFNGTSYVKFPEGTTAQRPGTLLSGQTRFNSSTGELETYTGSTWGDVTVRVADGVIGLWRDTIQTSYTLPTDRNGLSVGPVTVNSGVTVTIPSGRTWTVI